MRRTLVLRGGPALAWAAWALCSAGCGKSEPGYGRFIPPEPAAREALATALDAWHAGPASKIQTPAGRRVELTDCQQRDGRRLKGYEIIGEVVGDGHRTFAVKLTLDGPSGEVKARYHVLGLDPLWVFRQEDYEMLCHWECPEPGPQAKAEVPLGSP